MKFCFTAEMDHVGLENRDLEVDLESGARVGVQDLSKAPTLRVKSQPETFFSRICGAFSECMNKGDEDATLCSNVPNPDRFSGDYVKLEGEKIVDQKKVAKENHKKKSNKKHPKPPRPPRSPSLDAADEKLIKEISELVMLKRARIERMKALKKMKAAKASLPAASSSNSNLFATLFTIFFCLVILFQGMLSRVNSWSPGGSTMSLGSTSGGLLAVRYIGNPSVGNQNLPGSLSPGSTNLVGSDSPDNHRRAAG